jgi:hypothetical protein
VRFDAAGGFVETDVEKGAERLEEHLPMRRGLPGEQHEAVRQQAQLEKGRRVTAPHVEDEVVAEVDGVEQKPRAQMRVHERPAGHWTGRGSPV